MRIIFHLKMVLGILFKGGYLWKHFIHLELGREERVNY